MKKREILVAVGVATVIGVIVWLLSGPMTQEDRISKSSNRSTGSAKSSGEEADPAVRRERERSTATRLHERNLTSHEPKQLKDFILPVVEGRNVSIDQALSILKDAYQEACFRSREKPLALGFSVKDSSSHAISFSLHGKSFLNCLDHLAALAGLTVKREELNFVLSRSATADQPAELSIRKHPFAMLHLRALAGQASTGTESDWESLLRSTGLILDEDTTLSAGKDGGLIVKGSNAEIARVKSGLDLATQPPVQLKVAMKLITTTSPLDGLKGGLAEAEAQLLLRQISEQPGSQFVTQPSLSAREGESATLEMIQETHDGQGGWTGYKNTYQAARTGMKVVCIDQSEHRPAKAEDLGWLTDTDTATNPGESHLQLMASRDGTYNYRLITVTPIDATGRPLRSQDDVVYEDPDAPKAGNEAADGDTPTANRVPGSPRFVFSPYSNKIIDVEGYASGSLVADPYMPASEKKLFRVP